MLGSTSPFHVGPFHLAAQFYGEAHYTMHTSELGTFVLSCVSCLLGLSDPSGEGELVTQSRRNGRRPQKKMSLQFYGWFDGNSLGLSFQK